MLGPLDCFNINSFLGHFPQWTEKSRKITRIIIHVHVSIKDEIQVVSKIILQDYLLVRKSKQCETLKDTLGRWQTLESKVQAGSAKNSSDQNDMKSTGTHLISRNLLTCSMHFSAV